MRSYINLHVLALWRRQTVRDELLSILPIDLTRCLLLLLNKPMNHSEFVSLYVSLC